MLLPMSDKCSGCRVCLLTCALHNLGLNNPKYGAISIISHFPEPGKFEVKTCNQCGSCQDVCPAGAIHQLANGFFEVNKEECTGCGLCVETCPNHVIRMVAETKTAFLCVGCKECIKYCPREAIVDSDGEVTRV